MEVEKGKVILFLLGCLLLAGCGQEAESGGQQADVPESAVIAATVDEEETNTETVNAEMKNAEPEEAAHRSMLVISVLGKEKLAIETERLYADKSRPGYLDNCFTPEETDTILNAIQGAWSIDEYVGFAPYATVEQWMGEGTYEEKREKYRELKEGAEKNPPDFFFQVKGGSGEESAVSSHYIYVYNGNKVYASPMSIVLSKQEEEKPYQGRFIAYARPMDGGGDWSYNDNYHNISGQESFAVEGSIYIESVLAGDVSDRWPEETGRFCYDTPVEKYKAFLEELEQGQAVNREESIYAFHVPENISREIVLSDYSETFPVNLQEALVYANDDIQEEEYDNAWMEYRAECEYEYITIEIDGYASPFENVNALEADIDSDGEKEYIFSVSEGGTAHDVRTIVAKSINGEWVQIGGLTSKNSAVRALLEWEDQYYLLMGNHLAYWNGEADEPNWKEHPVPGQAECWNTLSIEKKVTGYTPLEVYSLEAVSVDYLKNVDFINSDDHSADDITPSAWAYWQSENYSFLVKRIWTQKTKGEEYHYIVSEITGGTNYRDDLLMAVCRRTEDERIEAVALYYLMANYEITFREEALP